MRRGSTLNSIEKNEIPVMISVRGEQYFDGVDPDATELMTEGTLETTDTGLLLRYRESELTVPRDATDGDGLNFLAGASMDHIRDRAMEGTLLAHSQGGVPNIIIEAEGKTPRALGELIYFFEYACGLSGYLLDVNPFDQPGVEGYKSNMFALLGKPGYETRRAELEARLNARR